MPLHHAEGTQRVARTALNKCVSTCTPVQPKYLRSSAGIPPPPVALRFLRLLMQTLTSSNMNSSPSPRDSCPGRAHSAASAACARATDALSSCVASSRARAMAAVNAASAAAFASSVVQDAPISGWQNEGSPGCGAQLPRVPAICAWRTIPGTYGSGRHTCVQACRGVPCAQHVPPPYTPCWRPPCRLVPLQRTYGLQSISRMIARRRSLYRLCKPAFRDAHDNRAPAQRRHYAASKHVHNCGGHLVNPLLDTWLRSPEIERGVRTSQHGK